MDFRQFEYLTAIAESQNFSIAAEKLFVTRNTLVYFLSKLENEIGAELFYRTKSDLVPTKIGEIYIEMANNILNEYHRCTDRINLESNTIHSTLRVNSIYAFTDKLIPHIALKFREIYPNIRLENPHGVNDERLLRDLVNGKVDMTLASTFLAGIKKAYGELVEFSNPLMLPLLLVMPKDYPIPQDMLDNPNKPVDVRRFYNETFYVPTYGTPVTKLFDKVGIPPKTEPTATAFASYEYVTLGSGLGLITPVAIRDHTAVRCFRIEHAPDVEYCVIYRKNAILTKPMRTFIKLREQIWEEKYGWANDLSYI